MKNNNRLTAKLNEIKSHGGKALVFFLTAGFPGLKATEKIILALERGGADIIELGVPFSDPVADGPAIQFSSQKALEKRISLKQILDFSRNLQKKTSIPVILMSYLNPVYKMGIKKFFNLAKKSGISGVLITDLIPEESPLIKKISGQAGMPLVFFTAPTTSMPRRKLIAKMSGGFIYAVSLTGVTGERKNIRKEIIPFLRNIKKITDKPVFAGFGISKPYHAKSLVKYADGVIIGSALVNLIKRTPVRLLAAKAGIFAKKFRRAIDG